MLTKKGYPLTIIAIIVVLLQQILYINSFAIDSTNNATGLDLLLLHNNDMHAHFEQTDSLSNTCSPNEAAANQCYGGFARVSSMVKQYRHNAENGGSAVLYLNAGDSYTGTPWFSIFRHKVVTDFMNILKPDAMALGNHEFDDGLDGLIPFLNGTKFPILAANINNSAEHRIWKTRALKKSLVLKVRGVSVGIIGYLTPETKTSNIDIEFESEIETINTEAEIMDKNGVKVIIALGHSGYDFDMKIAKNCPLVDVVVGGHTHSFLYSGSNHTQSEQIAGPYPTVITQANGKRVPVVQAYAFTKYMGEMKLKFDMDGNLVQFTGRVILLDYRIPRDPEVMALEGIYQPKLDDLTEMKFGVTEVYLNGTNCRFVECNIGNMVSSALIISASGIDQQRSNNMTNASIAIFASGDIRASIEMGNITKFDLDTALPYPNPLVVVQIPGKILYDVLEHAVHRYSDTIGRGEFLQMSGIRVIYDLKKAVGERVISVSIPCSICDTSTFTELDPNQKYGVVITSYLYEGGDEYSMFKNFTAHQLNVTVRTAVENYIKKIKVVSPVLNGRIEI